MKKAFQYKVAVISIMLFSKTVFAADIKFNTAPSITVSPSRPGSVPVINPNPSKPHLGGVGPLRLTPKLPSFDSDKKLPGTFGSPLAELLKGNLANARASCIQDAIQAGDTIPVDVSSVWNFASTYGSTSLNLPAAPKSTGRLTLPSSSKAAAFANAAMCGEDLRHSACVSLMDKSMNEVTQAYHNSEITNNPSLWDDVLDFLGFSADPDSSGPRDIVSAMKTLREKEGGFKDPAITAAFTRVESQDPLLVATNLLIAKIDESLARGDREGSDKAKILLGKINPSAAYATSCVLGSLTQGGLNDNLDAAGRPKGAYLGPLSGVDYSRENKIKETGFLQAAWVAIAVTVVIAGITYYQNSKKNEDEKKDRRNAQFDKRVRDYLECTSGPVCNSIYPEEAKFVDEARKNEEAKNGSSAGAGTVNPVHPDPNEPVDMFAPSIPSKPGKGSGGSGGELTQVELIDPVSDLERKAKDQHLFSDRSFDPSAAQEYCEKIVTQYKRFSSIKSSMGGRPINAPSGADVPIPNEAFGVAHFENWNADFWNKLKQTKMASDPSYRNQQNNCQAMDKVEGL